MEKLTKDFLEAFKEIELVLLSLLFNKKSFFEKGLAYYIEFRNENNTNVEFLFGPSEWNIEMRIYTSKGKFAFKDLLIIPEVNRWVNVNRFKQENGRNVKNEWLWYIELLKISLPFIE